MGNGNLIRKLRAVTRVLEKWSKKKFPNNLRRIGELNQEIQSITNSQGLLSDRNRADCIKGELEEIWRCEEMYWGLRSRINWLKWGNKNTNYFHATTIQRRNKNRIKMLKLMDDESTRDVNLIKQKTDGHFRELYTSVGQRNIQPVFDLCPCIVQAEMNDSLTSEVTMEEIYVAAFQLGSTKALVAMV